MNDPQITCHSQGEDEWIQFKGKKFERDPGHVTHLNFEYSLIKKLKEALSIEDYACFLQKSVLMDEDGDEWDNDEPPSDEECKSYFYQLILTHWYVKDKIHEERAQDVLSKEDCSELNRLSIINKLSTCNFSSEGWKKLEELGEPID